VCAAVDLRTPSWELTEGIMDGVLLFACGYIAIPLVSDGPTRAVATPLPIGGRGVFYIGSTMHSPRAIILLYN